MLEFVGCDPQYPDDACCENLFEQGTAIITAAGEGLRECLGSQSCCDRPMRAYVSLGPPAVWQSDLLVAYVENPGFTYSPKTYGPSGNFSGPPQIRVLWRIYLIESGYPGLVQIGGDIYVPNDDQLHHANRHLYAHGESMMRGILGTPALTRCGGFAMRDMTFVGPNAGPEEGDTAWHAGWSIGLTLDLKA